MVKAVRECELVFLPKKILLAGKLGCHQTERKKVIQVQTIVIKDEEIVTESNLDYAVQSERIGNLLSGSSSCAYKLSSKIKKCH